MRHCSMGDELLRIPADALGKEAQQLLNERQGLAALVDRGQPRSPIGVKEIRLLRPIARAVIVGLCSRDGIVTARESRKAGTRVVHLQDRLPAEREGNSSLVVEERRRVRACFRAASAPQLARALVENHPSRGLIELSLASRSLLEA